MADPGIVAIRVRRGDTVFTVHGQGAGTEGVYLASGQVAGIYDAPIKSTWKTGAFQVGSTQKAIKRIHRDMELGFHIGSTPLDSFEFNESLFRQIFFYERDQWSTTPKDTTIEVQTEMSGLRKLDVLMYEEPEFAASVDPLMQQYGNLILKLRAGEPMWYEDDVITQFTSDATSASGTVTVSNPTDQIMYYKWIVTPGIWTLPDFQWQGDPGERMPGGPNASRMINDITITPANGGAVIDLDRQELMYRDLAGSNILGQIGASKIFNYPVPPYTPEFDLPVSYKGQVGGATVQLVQPRRWSRPYGLEAVTVLNTASPKDLTQRFSFPGSFSYRIPDWAERLDIVVIGGGGGGEGGGLVITGSGGSASTMQYATVIRGVDIPYSTKFLVGSIGAGGLPGKGLQDFGSGFSQAAADGWGGNNGLPGNNSSVVGSGLSTLESVGGAGGLGQPQVAGQGVPDLLFNGKTYPGCGDEITPGNQGNNPGGGGAGGWPLVGPGGAGGNGQVWIRAYGWSGS